MFGSGGGVVRLPPNALNHWITHSSRLTFYQQFSQLLARKVKSSPSLTIHLISEHKPLDYTRYTITFPP